MNEDASSVAGVGDTRGLRVYADYIAEQVTLQDARKESIESRALVVITSSGALATLLLGLAAFARESEAILLSDAAQKWLRVAALAFLIAGVLALAANLPLPYRRVDIPDLEAAVDGADGDSEFSAIQAVAYNRLDLVKNAAKVTEWKARVLVLGLAAELVAVAAIARCVWLIL